MNGTRTDKRPRWPRTNCAELVGRRFGRLTVTAETAGRGSNGAIVWECRCRCGGVAHALTHNLTSGNTTSCGCRQVAASRRANRRGGARWR